MKNLQKGFAVPVIIAIVALLAIGGGYAYYKSNNVKTTPLSPVPNIENNLVGSDKDSHGCIGSAGYSWCAVKNKCLRVWEEKCEVAPISTTTNSVVCTMDAMMCPDGTYVGRSAPDCKFICPSVSDKCVEGDVKRYTCPNGSQVNWCGCSETGSFTCIISPEAKCN